MTACTRLFPKWRRRCLWTLLSAALHAALPCPAQAEARLGRVFFSAEERQALDRQRLTTGKTVMAAAPSVTVNGVVTRPNGTRTTWLNGVADEDRSGTDPAVVTILDRGGKRTAVRVGATLQPDSGVATDLVGDGRLTVAAPRRSDNAPRR